MKLLLCLKCSDVVKLRKSVPYCECGKSSGRYLDDINAEYRGDDAMLLGFANGSLIEAIREQQRKGDSELTFEHGVYAGQPEGRKFTAFVIPESATSIRKLK